MVDSIEERVARVVRGVLKIGAEDLTPESRFAADLGAESVQSVELVAAFEEEFEITMDEDKALAVKTLGEAVTFIKRCIAEQHG